MLPALCALTILIGCHTTFATRELEERGGGWTNAYWVSQQDLTAATQAICPSWAPINCNAIQEPDYCCTPSTYCAFAADKSVGCCPWGQTCSSNVAGGAGGGGWQQQPTTTTWQQQPSTVYVTEGHATTTVVYVAGQQTQQWTTQQQQTVYNGQQYCSTLYAHGGNLPTTEAGTCGTILIANDGGLSQRVTRKGLVLCILLVVAGLIFQMTIRVV